MWNCSWIWDGNRNCHQETAKFWTVSDLSGGSFSNNDGSRLIGIFLTAKGCWMPLAFRMWEIKHRVWIRSTLWSFGTVRLMVPSPNLKTDRHLIGLCCKFESKSHDIIGQNFKEIYTEFRGLRYLVSLIGHRVVFPETRQIWLISWMEMEGSKASSSVIHQSLTSSVLHIGTVMGKECTQSYCLTSSSDVRWRQPILPNGCDLRFHQNIIN